MSEKLLTLEECEYVISRTLEEKETCLRLGKYGVYFTPRIICWFSHLEKQQDRCWRLYVLRPHYAYVDGRLIRTDEHKDITHIITGEQHD